jgi:putative ABC transport system permease protein
MLHRLQNLRYALRGFRRSPGFTLVVVLTLALGIGANTAIFTVVNAVLLRPLPMADDARLTFMQMRSEEGHESSVSIPNYFSWNELNRVYSSTGLFRTSNVNLGGDNEPERLLSVQVLGELWQTLGRAPLLGRTFAGTETLRGAERVAVISHGLWQRRFGGDPEALGTKIVLDGEPFSLIGVMPADFFFPFPESEIWLPMGVYADVLPWEIRGNSPGSYAIGRLRDDVDLDQARQDMRRVGGLVNEEFGDRLTPEVEALRERFLGDIRTGLVLIFAAVGFVLLIACANVANLLLSRAESRQREVAVRCALGAGNAQILRQMATESLTLALAGGLAGAALGWAGLQALVAALPADTPFLDRITIDSRVLLFTLLVSLGTGLVFGLAPGLHLLRADLRGSLKEGGGRSGGRGGGRLRAALVVTEVAMALVLLFGATVMMRSFSRLQTVDPGFDARNVLTLRISPPMSSYPDTGSQVRLFESVVERASAIPGVEAAAVNNGVPLASGGTESGSIPEGRPLEAESFESCLYQAASADYFRAMGIPLLKGRGFESADTSESVQVALVDETMARKFWPDEDPIGRKVAFEFRGSREAPEPVWRDVVGVVGHVRHYELRSPSRVQIYVPFTQPPIWFDNRPATMAVFLKTRSQPESVLPAFRSALREIDASLPLFGVQTMEDVLVQEVANDRLVGSNLGVFAALALTLAAIGLYGVMAYAVAQRTHELGLRMALGAPRQDILKLVLSGALRLVGIGIVIGLVLVAAAGRLLKGFLFEVSAADPITLISIVVLLLAVGLLASTVPAWRASRIDPLFALRYE